MDVTPLFGPPEKADSGLSALSRGLVGSEILKIAGEIRALTAKGAEVCNLTVGDFDPRYFPIPEELLEATRDALAAGQTNYPPSDGVLLLREAIVRYYERELGLKYPVESVIVASGARPLVYAAYKTILDPGDVALYPVPSWNNNHYTYLSGGKAVEIPVSASTNFFPTVDEIRPHLPAARLLLINSPNNPTGTVIAREELRRITEAVVEENRRREAAGARPLWFVYDQVYWALTFGGAIHVTPVELVPESAPYTLLLDAISKSFCATGLRVGWGVVPPAVRKRMTDFLGHVGAWAPKAEQVAVSKLLDRPDVIGPYQSRVRENLKARLDALYAGFMELKREGLPVNALMPQGAIYLSGRFDLFGRTFRGKPMRTNEDIRRLLLDEAGLGMVPFQAFGLMGETGWFRLSVGAVSMEDISAVFPRLRALLGAAVGVAS
jgi:aspartate aminotransferase